MKDDGILGILALQFFILAFFAFGGANAVVPEIHRQAVDIFGWMDNRTFADLMTIAQVAPGPNVMLVTLVGYHVAGIAGAAVATVAMCGPTAVLASFLAGVWDRFRDRPWRMIVQAGFVPISVGLVTASSIIFLRLTAQSGMAITITVVTASVVLFTRFNPLWLFAVGIILGLAGFV